MLNVAFLSLIGLWMSPSAAVFSLFRRCYPPVFIKLVDANIAIKTKG
jgi:hypothetical protein